MKKNLVSIIIPVYNSEKYLKRCLNSVVGQTYKNIEIIVVNDGSLDNSLNIINEYAGKDNRMIVIDKENGGVSEARNAGLMKATGEFIMFVDADDTIENNSVEICINNIMDYDAIRFCMNEVKADGNLDIYPDLYNSYNDMILTSSAMMTDLANGEISGHCTLLFYRKDIILKNKLLFNKNFVYCEDLLFVLSYVKYCNNIKVLNDTLYCYYSIADGATKNDANKIRNLKTLPMLKKEMFKIFEDKKYFPLYNKTLLKLVVFYYSVFAKDYSLLKFKQIVREINGNIMEIFTDIDLNDLGKGSKLFINFNVKNRLTLLYLYLFVFNKLKW